MTTFAKPLAAWRPLVWLAVLAGCAAGCRGPAPAIAPAPAAPPPPSAHPHLTVGCLALERTPFAGAPARVVFTIVNDGDWPVLLRGITPQQSDDEVVSWLVSYRKRLRYDARRRELVETGEAGTSPFEHRTLYRGLLLPGEAIEAYATVLPHEAPRSRHRFRLDYLAAPPAQLLARLHVAEPSGSPRRRRFRPARALGRSLGAPRLRRVLLQGRPRDLVARSVAFTLDLDTVRPSPIPFERACRIARLHEPRPALWSQAAGGWAFPDRRRGVVVVGRDGVHHLQHVSLRALREIAGSDRALRVRVIDEDMARELARLEGASVAHAPDGAIAVQLQGTAAAPLLALAARHGWRLDADPEPGLPPGARCGARQARLSLHRP